MTSLSVLSAPAAQADIVCDSGFECYFEWLVPNNGPDGEIFVESMSPLEERDIYVAVKNVDTQAQTLFNPGPVYNQPDPGDDTAEFGLVDAEGCDNDQLTFRELDPGESCQFHFKFRADADGCADNSEEVEHCLVDTVNAGQTDVHLPSIDVYASFELIPVDKPRPDNLIRPPGGSFVGNDVYNTTGANQSLGPLNTARGTTRTYEVRTENDGGAGGTLKLFGCGNSAGFKVTYWLGTTNITTKVRTATFKRTLSPGGKVTVKVKIKVLSTAGVGTTKKCAVKASGGGTSDVVVAKAKAT